MDVVALKAGHDGSIAYVRDGKLEFCHESEKDSFERHAEITPELLLSAIERVSRVPDVIVDSGWSKSFPIVPELSKYGAGYAGVSGLDHRATVRRFFGKEIQYYSCTHERAHIMCSYALSPPEFSLPCAVLVWEGTLGDFYVLNEDLSISHVGTVREHIGNIYLLPFWIANTARPNHFSLGIAGKAMALAAYGADRAPTASERQFVDFLLDRFDWHQVDQTDFSGAPCYRTGIRSPELAHIMNLLTAEVFERFHNFARVRIEPGLPLLISGGCGLNCQWNDWWTKSPHFTRVFIPPCCNDSGVAIGAAADAIRHLHGDPKLAWSVNSGAEFVWDTMPDTREFTRHDINYWELAEIMLHGGVIAWVQGKCDIGPRSLGSRSLFACPKSVSSRQRLNAIKSRDNYRPVAPICVEEVAHKYFVGPLPSKYMLSFHHCISPDLPAVTHVDGSARLQTVASSDHPSLYRLLQTYDSLAGVPVLCNTSLNFPGLGFINRMSDLLYFVRERRVEAFVVGDHMFLPARQ